MSLLLKNTYGLTTILSPKSRQNKTSLSLFAGSSLNRKQSDKKQSEETENKSDFVLPNKVKNNQSTIIIPASDLALREKAFYEDYSGNYSFSEIISKSYNQEAENEFEDENKSKKQVETKTTKLRSMSARTKQKIKKKVFAFSQVYNKLNFLTLTFINKIEDKQAVKILAKFLDNCNKQMKDFQYIWVAERQTKNEMFKDNIHFHLITNKYFKIDKYWDYWLKLQEKNGITARNKNFKASSAFDIKRLNAKNVKAIGLYITKYVTKNKDEFDCQVWNCSKKISMLYTDFYSDYDFIENVEKVLETELEPIPAEYCTIYPIPLNRRTIPMYERLNEKNRKLLKR